MPNEDKASRYHRLRRRAATAATAAAGLALLLLMLSGGAAALRTLVEGAAGTGSIGVGLYACVLVLLVDLVQLPFVYYQGLALERRFGLSTHAPQAWWRDHVKSLLLSLVLASAAAIMVVQVMRAMPEFWWLAAGGLVALLVVLLTGAAPVLLFPLFYRITPLDRPDLSARLLALARQGNTAVMGVFEWRLSDRTRKANAALAGLGATRRILLSDTLLASHSDEEIEVILAHELAHHVHRDIWTALALEGLSLMAALFATDAVLRRMEGHFGLMGAGDPAVLPVLAVTAGAVSLLLRPVAFAVSRAHERRADRYALELTHNATAFVSALRRLSSQNMADDRPSRLVQWLFHSHPSTTERIAAARRWADCRGL